MGLPEGFGFSTDWQLDGSNWVKAVREFGRISSKRPVARASVRGPRRNCRDADFRERLPLERGFLMPNA